MEDDGTMWPVDPSLLSSSLVFRPKGYLVAILPDLDEGERASQSLEDAGYASADLMLYSGEKILANHDLYLESRTVGSKVIGAVTDDIEGRDLYLAYAREGRSALWVRIPNEADVPKALRALANHQPLHTRYYGDDRQDDVHIS